MLTLSGEAGYDTPQSLKWWFFSKAAAAKGNFEVDKLVTGQR